MTKNNTKNPLRPVPSAGATPMSAEDVAKAFNQPKADKPNHKAEDFKGALLTEERVIVYTKMEKRVGQDSGKEMYIFHNPFSRTLVFPAESVVDTGIEGLISDDQLPKND